MSLISTLSPLGSDRTQGSFSIFLHFLRAVLWHNIWSIFEKVPCATEKKVNLLVDGWNILYMSIKSRLLIVLLSSMVSLVGFCLEELSSSDSSVLKSRIIVLWSI